MVTVFSYFLEEQKPELTFKVVNNFLFLEVETSVGRTPSVLG